MSSHMSAQPLPGPGSKNARAGAGRALLSTGVREKGGSATSEARPSSARSASSMREDANGAGGHCRHRLGPGPGVIGDLAGLTRLHDAHARKSVAGAWLLAGGCFGGAPRGFFMLTAR
jgi:hypothetical protein